MSRSLLLSIESLLESASSQSKAYFDWSASSPMSPLLKEKLLLFSSLGALNPVSMHTQGQRAFALWNAAKESILTYLNQTARAYDVVTLGTATEANNAVLSQGWDVVFYSAYDHASVKAKVEELETHKVQLIRVPILERSRDLDLSAAIEVMESLERPVSKVLWVSTWVNGELGWKQDLLAQQIMLSNMRIKLKEKNIELGWLIDASQGVGRLGVKELHGCDYDFLTFSGHKLGGPVGIAALVLKRAFVWRPLVVGGGQQDQRQSGTPAVLLTLALAIALEDLSESYVRKKDELQAQGLQVRQALNQAGFVFLPSDVVTTQAFFSKRGNTSQDIVLWDALGIQLSSGSACSSGQAKSVALLEELPEFREKSKQSLRLSWGPSTSEDDFSLLFSAIQKQR